MRQKKSHNTRKLKIKYSNQDVTWSCPQHLGWENRNSLCAFFNSFLTKWTLQRWIQGELGLKQSLLRWHLSHTKRVENACLTLRCSSFCPRMIQKANSFYFYEFSCPLCLICAVIHSLFTSAIKRKRNLPAQFALAWKEWLMQTGSGMQQNTPYQHRQVLI